jgi:hypothetical protein
VWSVAGQDWRQVSLRGISPGERTASREATQAKLRWDSHARARRDLSSESQVEMAQKANPVVFLVGEDARGANGQVIRANGVIGGQTQGHGPGISTGARHGEKRHADQVNINSWRSS